MPVPVPLVSQPPAHPVHKRFNSHSGAPHPSIHTLTHSLPHPPPGPPPSYGTREEWISSLPDWRRNKPRRIWEEDDTHTAAMKGFLPGLTNAANASVIKGPRAQACIPPQISLIDRPSLATNLAAARSLHDDLELPDDEEMDSSFEYDVESQWSAHSYGSDENTMDVDVDGFDLRHRRTASAGQVVSGIAAAYSAPAIHYDRGAFTPVFEAPSPDHDDRADPGSSPLGPVTPFGEFVDRAVASVSYDRNPFPSANVAALPSYVPKADLAFAHPVLPPFQPHQEPDHASVAEPTSASSSAVDYKRVADPLADWMAMYVWKVCTTGMSLPYKYQPRAGQHELRYSSLPPVYLANAIRSLFMSTLLQPSAILLSVWYIIQLPVCFGSMDRPAERSDETYFRTELLGVNEWRGIGERDAIEMDATFRLVLLGCMLANKWLDDHTFSNKTWHAISGVPILSLNRLEVYALGIFRHDLSVPTGAWLKWLEHVLAYQAASSPIGPPQPISRPSSDPRVIVRRTVEELLGLSTQLSMARPCGDPRCERSHIEPVFVSRDERKTRVDQSSVELEIDLDEDGPLREEYMPRRRVSRVGVDRPAAHGDEWAVERSLPPPAKWSPSADEPLARGTNDRNRQYVAVQAPPAPLLRSTGMYAPWSAVPVAPLASKVQLPPIYAASYPHSRSMSLSNAPPGMQEPPAGHTRSTSHSQQPHFGYRPFDGMQFLPPASWIRA
ncbi:hypothetical protein K488DRAFT_77967 [Vararia minispora EC-137]|uniref:Uncharacterized protein n=1 Tax=Vararia minispora EC-137 TaxID=1314806 RepID=A0ACB8QNU6_9AGAM|nr:hypothetical protein K488DRAFT_77967 [Vararia minispora EC-137]